MNEVYVKAEDLTEETLLQLPNKDFFTIGEIVDCLQELAYDYESLKEEFEDYKENVDETMVQRTHWSAKQLDEYRANEL